MRSCKQVTSGLGLGLQRVRLAIADAPPRPPAPRKVLALSFGEDEGEDGFEVPGAGPPGSASADPMAIVPSLSAASSVELLKGAPAASLVCFRVSHKRPSGRKRPTAQRDDINAADIAIAQYQILSQSPEELRVKAIHSADPALSRILDGPKDDIQRVQDSMLQWQAVSVDDMQLNLPNGRLSTEEESVLEDVFAVRAIAGTDVYFDGNGFPGNSGSEFALKSLLGKNILVEHAEESLQVQLSPSWVQCHVQILQRPSKVFSIRMGVPFDANAISRNFKPTALEVQLRMGQLGWELKSGRRFLLLF